MADSPLITVFTRHLPHREKLFKRCVSSLARQTCQDFKHLIIVDKDHLGIAEADKMFHRNLHLVTGKYTYMLDDDDYLIDTEFFQTVEDISNRSNSDVIIARMQRALSPFNDILPPDYLWDTRPVAGKIGAPCFVIKTSIWKQHCYLFGWPTYGNGDHCLIATLWDKGYSFHWLNRVVVRIDQIGHEVDRPCH